jgi:hypothetical protein
MKRLINIFIVFLLGFVFLGGKSQVFAQQVITSCSSLAIDVSSPNLQTSYIKGASSNSFTVDVDHIPTPGETYELKSVNPIGGIDFASMTGVASSDSTVHFIVNDPEFFTTIGQFDLHLEGPGIDGIGISHICHTRLDYSVVDEGYRCTQVSFWQESNGQICTYANNGCLNTTDPIHIQSTIFQNSTNTPAEGLAINHNLSNSVLQPATTNNLGIATTIHGALSQEEQRLYVEEVRGIYNPSICIEDFVTRNDCECTTTGEDPPNSSAEVVGADKFSLCKQIPLNQVEQRQECMECVGGSEDDESYQGVWTAIGCIKRDPFSIMQRLISVGLGMAGGVALLTFLAAGFIYSTSQGDPKNYGKAKEMMTAAVIGIIFIIFSVTLLQFIGYDILKIPGFGE